MKAISLFAGVGGIEIGFEQQEIETVWANEIDEKAAETFRLNHTTSLVVGDLADIESRNIPNADIILAGFPCQPFSVAGYRKGFEDDRGNAFFLLARVIRDIQPRIIFLENVKNLLGHDRGNTYRVISSTLEAYGYHLSPMVLNASEYGNIPQNRERIYVIGFRDLNDYKNFIPPAPIPLVTKISDIVDFDLKVDDKFYYTKDNCYFYEQLEEKVLNPETVYQWRRVYVRENQSNLCPTLTANMGGGGHNVPIVLTKHGFRKLTPKESFRFQGFPEEFQLPDIAQSHLYKQAGNSVVVPVISRLAESIATAVSRK